MSKIIQSIGDKIIIPSHKLWMGLEDHFPARKLYPRLSKKSILMPGNPSPSAGPGGADGWIGYYSTDYNEDTYTSLSNDDGAYAAFVTTTPGQVSYIHFRCGANGGNYNGAIYSSDGLTKYAEGNLTLITANTFGHIALDSPFTLIAATTYLLVIGAKDAAVGTSVIITNLFEEPYLHADGDWDVEDTLPTTCSDDWSAEYYRPIIWATNTSDGS